MIILYKTIYESTVQAFQALSGNKMRTFLSLLGIVIGIFCIIAVKSSVDSLQDNIISGFNELGSDVIYVDKFPWAEGGPNQWWKYEKRPHANFDDYKRVAEQSELASKVALTMYTGGKSIKYRSNVVSNIFIMASTYELAEIQNLKIEKGRYFTPSEYHRGSNKIVLGDKMATELFGNLEPIGKLVKIFGQKFQVIGVLKAEGENPFNIMNFDEVCWIGYNSARKFLNTRPDNMNMFRRLIIKAKEGVALSDLKDELTGELRLERKLKPSEESNFSLNELTMISDMLDSFFSILSLAGMFIGGFALLVGMFSVANIMFVSVKERTNIIGIKKALGAQRNVILLEFLIESIVLCVIGGIMGLILVFGVLKIISGLIPFDMYISFSNMAWGVVISILVGIIAGIIPAYFASKMDPVEAMRA